MRCVHKHGGNRGHWPPDYQQIGQQPSLQILKIQIQAQIQMKIQIQIKLQIQIQAQIQVQNADADAKAKNLNTNTNTSKLPKQRGEQQLPHFRSGDLEKAEKIKGRQACHHNHKEATLDTNREKTCIIDLNLQILSIKIWFICSTYPLRTVCPQKDISHTYHVEGNGQW